MSAQRLRVLGVFYVSAAEPREAMQLCVESVEQIDEIIESLIKARAHIATGQAARVNSFLPPGYYVPYTQVAYLTAGGRK